MTDITCTPTVIDVIPISTVIDVLVNPTGITITSNNATQYQVLEHTDGQTIFILNTIPSKPNLSQLFINELKYKYIVDYTISDNILTWLNPHSLDSGDILELYFI